MTDLDATALAWADWIADVCAALDVDPQKVDVAQVHDLTRAVATTFVRPMAPVSAYVWGLGVGRNPDADPAALRAAVAGAVPDSRQG